MFTGLVQHVGVLAETPQPTKSGVRLRVDALEWSHHPTFGDSIAVDGCCLTVVGSSNGVIDFDVIPQTLAVTSLGGLG
jgi:riboflavin synthase